MGMDTADEDMTPAIGAPSHGTDKKQIDRSGTTTMLRNALNGVNLTTHKLHPEAILEVWQAFGGDASYIQMFAQWLVNDNRIHSRPFVDVEWVKIRLEDLLRPPALDSPVDELELFNQMTDDMVNARLGGARDSRYKLVLKVINDSKQQPRRGEAKYSLVSDRAKKEDIEQLFFKFKRDGTEYICLRIQWWRFKNLDSNL